MQYQADRIKEMQMKRTLLLAAAALLCAGAGVRQAQASTSKAHHAALTVVKVCPITGEKVVGNGAGSEVVGAYKVYFCCGGCQPAFDKLSMAEKIAKIKAAENKS
jgi:hypothetical protein